MFSAKNKKITTIVIILLLGVAIIKLFTWSSFVNDEAGKLEINHACEFDGAGFDRDHEVGECSVAVQVIPLCKNVIEIGGGTGKVSHMINSILARRDLQTQHIVVEPGSAGRGHHGDTNLGDNKIKFDDKYTIVKKMCEDLTMDDLKVLVEKPDCLFVDCEACLLKFQATEIGRYILSHVRFIVNEMDGDFVLPGTDEQIREQWRQFGFKNIGNGYGCGKSCITEIWGKI